MIIIVGILGVAIALLIIIIPCWFEANLYNKKLGTKYTTLDFLMAGDSIRDYLESGKQKTLNLKIKSEDRED